MRLRSAVLSLAICLVMSTTLLATPAFSQEFLSINYPGSYYESVYIAKGIGTDNYVNAIDVALLVRAFGNSSTDPWGVGWHLYNPDADVDGSGEVDIFDAIALAGHFGINYEYSPFVTEPGKPKVMVVAPVQAVKIGEQFTVDIEIKGVEGLNAYEFTLNWNPNLLKYISVVCGGFIPTENSHLVWLSGPDYLYVGDNLYYRDADGLLQPATQSGKGILATITFECLDKGRATLDLSSRLFDIDLNSMPHKDIDGTVTQRP